MSLPRLIHTVFHSPWAIQPSFLESIFSVLHAREGQPLSPADASWVSQDAPRIATTAHAYHCDSASYAALPAGTSGSAITARIAGPKVAVIFAQGVMGKHLSAMEEDCAGGMSIDRVSAALRQAADDPDIDGIMLHLHTPGGVIFGVPELGSLVAHINANVKPVAAYCDSITASAGYWTIANASAIYLTPSASVGSIGAYCAHVSYEEFMAKRGIKVTLFASGEHKGAGAMGIALTDTQASLIAADVAESAQMFYGAVRRGRLHAGDVAAETMQGQCFMGQAAVNARLADAVVNDISEALADFAISL
jgi:signal peptide peptidase SppA